MSRQALSTTSAPAAIGPYSQGIASDDYVYCSGQIGLDPATGEVKPEFQPNSSIGGPGDKLHPNRAGYAAMANAIDLPMITGRGK